ncbi:unnamed protein product [Acanthoscelides obtectus]|uniref:DDE-1 domain-containing protein n=1 Tax=Acanthoscelides obtectus TaxID=200917 RepID=A0A9P0PZD8_ACAOB|nr:unnamed protein product [Acanthoscelides obtectus]CAK1656975.1 hypothetical protein AOBTE_LOCUS20052 [Acanthoscelides obtectus]
MDDWARIQRHFIDHVEPSPFDPVLLLLDNHSSLLDNEVIEIAKENNVVLLSFLSHCSHKLQPMDVGVYEPFKNYCASQQDIWLRSSPGRPIDETASSNIQNIPART